MLRPALSSRQFGPEIAIKTIDIVLVGLVEQGIGIQLQFQITLGWAGLANICAVIAFAQGQLRCPTRLRREIQADLFYLQRLFEGRFGFGV